MRSARVSSARPKDDRLERARTKRVFESTSSQSLVLPKACSSLINRRINRTVVSTPNSNLHLHCAFVRQELLRIDVYSGRGIVNIAENGQGRVDPSASLGVNINLGLRSAVDIWNCDVTCSSREGKAQPADTSLEIRTIREELAERDGEGRH